MINTKSFITALKSLKIKKNSSCFLHTSIINLGCFEDNKIDNIPDNIFRLLKKIIGKNGTISVLGSNYDVITKKKKFDISNCRPNNELGSFSKYLWKLSSSKRSFNPIFNIISVGKYANFITKKRTPIAFGEDSPWHQLFKLDSEIIFLGCDLSVCTFIRYIEFRFGVPYLYNKLFKNNIFNKKKKLFNYSSSTLRYRKSQIIYNLKKFEKKLIKKKFLRIYNDKKIKIMAIKMKPLFYEGIEMLKKDLFYFLKKKPNFKNNFNPTK